MPSQGMTYSGSWSRLTISNFVINLLSRKKCFWLVIRQHHNVLFLLRYYKKLQQFRRSTEISIASDMRKVGNVVISRAGPGWVGAVLYSFSVECVALSSNNPPVKYLNKRCHPLLGNGTLNTLWCNGIATHNKHAKIEELLKAVFPVRSEYLHSNPASRRRRQKGGTTGQSCSWGYKYGDLALHVGESRIWHSKIWSWVPRSWDPGMIALATASSNCKR
jgi:hypothetical protein